MNQLCKKCRRVLPATDANFGHTPNGALRKTCRACMSAHVKAYDKANPHMAKRRSDLRRDREAAAGVRDISFEEIQALMIRVKCCCFYCGKLLISEYQVDHMVPIARGGTHAPDNWTLACPACNGAKHGKTVREFLVWRRERSMPCREDSGFAAWQGA